MRCSLNENQGEAHLGGSSSHTKLRTVNYFFSGQRVVQTTEQLLTTYLSPKWYARAHIKPP